jgi:NRPS condensation-like uncharacterized protein
VSQNTIPSRIPAELADRTYPLIHPAVMHTVVSLSGRLDDDRLMRAVRLTLDAQPILGCTFVPHWFRPYWQRYENLDGMQFCDIHAGTNHREEIHDFFVAPLYKLPVRILLLRGEVERLCVKLDHRVGDGTSLQEYTYLLAEIYNRLSDDPNYVPVPHTTGSRSVRQISPRYTLREKGRIFRDTIIVARQAPKLGRWEYPVQRHGKLDYVAWKLNPDQVEAISDYGGALRATVNQVLLAALYIAACEAIPHSGEGPLPLRTFIDLRRYLPGRKTSTLSNLVGVCTITIDQDKGAALEIVVQQIRDQMKAQKKYIGLRESLFPVEAFSPFRQMAELVPFAYLKYLETHRFREIEQSFKDRSEIQVPGLIGTSTLGQLDESRLRFKGTEVIDAYATAGLFRVPGLLGLGVSGFRGCLTLHLGLGPTALVTRIHENIMQVLRLSCAARYSTSSGSR